MAPTALAFGGRNLTGGVRSSPVCGFNVCSGPPLDTAYRLLLPPRPPPPPGGAPRPAGGADDEVATSPSGVARVIVVIAPGHAIVPAAGGSVFRFRFQTILLRS